MSVMKAITLSPIAVAVLAAAIARGAEPAPVAGIGVRGERIIDRTGAAWQSQQVQEPCILDNPKDPTRLVMFYSGVPAADRAKCYIGKAWALKSDPFTWHQDPGNPVFGPGQDGWDSASIRLDCVLYVQEEDAYYIYYSGTDVADAHNRIGLAICPAGKDGYSGITAAAIRRHGAAPVLAPEPAEPIAETMASQAAVWRERDAAGQWRWYLYYSYRGRNGVLPGIRLATSMDGKSWQRHYNPDDPRRMGHLFASTPNAYYEWHQVFKVADTYVLSVEVGPNRGERWRTVLAVSRQPDKGWEQLDVDTVLQTSWPGIYSDDTIFHVATPAFYQIDGRWYLYTQACPLPADRNYISGKWDLWAFACDHRIPTRPGLADLFIPGAAATVPTPSAGARTTLSNPLITEATSWEEFEAAFPPRRPAAPIIRHGITPGMSNQVQHPCLLPDPQNPKRVFLYFTGCPPIYTGGVADIPGPNPRGENTIRRMYADASADLSLPASWTLGPNLVSSESTGSGWDDDRLGYLNAVLYHDADKTWYAYYWAGKTTSTRRIGVATSADGLRWRRFAGNPIITPGEGEFDIEAGNVIKEGDLWFMAFCVGNSPTRNGQTYKSAISKDGLHWTRAGTVLDMGKPGTSDAGAFEFGNIFKVGNRYALIYEAMNRYGGPGYRWTVNLAYSDSLTAEHWTRSARNPVFTGSGVPGSLDENHVGTPAVYSVNGRRYLFYQAIVTDGRNMDIAVATFDKPKGAPMAPQSAGGVTVPAAIAGDSLLAEAYRAAAEKNVLRALNPKVFFGYFAVCADGKGHGNNTTYPGLDWGQSAEALLWLGRTAEVLASWDYVKGFQRDDGLVPFAILPSSAGTTSMVHGRYPLTVDKRGAVFVHWVPGNPLRTLANVTFLLLADAIWTQTGDRAWLQAQAPCLRKAAEWLLKQITPDALMPGGGFYVERPTRLEFDGINQCATPPMRSNGRRPCSTRRARRPPPPATAPRPRR